MGRLYLSVGFVLRGLFCDAVVCTKGNHVDDKVCP